MQTMFLTSMFRLFIGKLWSFPEIILWQFFKLITVEFVANTAVM